MKKKFLIFMTVLIVVMLALTVVACNDYSEPDNTQSTSDSITRNQVVTNGTFYNASSSNSDDYIKTTVNGWTATKGSSAVNDNGVTMGVVDLQNTAGYDVVNTRLFSENLLSNTTELNPGVDGKTPEELDDFGNPISGQLQDTNALVIASRVDAGSVYYKNSSSFSLDANSYYLLQYSVATFVDMDGEDPDNASKKGAWVHVTGGIEYVDSCINTNGKWETHYLYIETNKYNTTTLDIRLWLGHGPKTIDGKTNPYITKGVAFFDNVICTKVTTAQDEVYNNNEVATLDHATFEAMAATAYSANGKIGYESCYYLVDTKLEQMTETTPTTTNAIKYYYSFREGSYSSLNTKNFNTVKGTSGITSSEETSITNAYIGIVNYSKLYNEDAKADADGNIKNNYSALLSEKLGQNFKAPSYQDWKDLMMNGENHKAGLLDETKALMIYHNDLSGYGFKTKTSVTIDPKKAYEISVWVYVWAPFDEEGEIILPSDSKPEEPASYGVKQILVDYFTEAKEFPANISFADYVGALSDEEEAIAKKAVDEFLTEADRTRIATFVANDSVKEAMEAAGYTADYSNNTAFQYLYVYENIDTFIANGDLEEADVDYVQYRYLKERENFVSTTWKDVPELMTKWENYEAEYAVWYKKYEVWMDNNKSENDPAQKYLPYAKFKLSGAGDDIEAKTTSCNKGWEQVTLLVEGNQISSRNLTLEFWFGEGTNTEYENLMIGGALFDNISIREVDKADYDANADWNELSPITDVDNIRFGGFNGELAEVESNINNYWKYELADSDKMADTDNNNISLTVAGEENVGQIKVGDEEITLNQLVYTHTEPTASVLTSKDGENHEYDIKVLPNKAYRFAIRVKTEGFEEDQSIAIALMGGGEDDEKANVSTISNFNSKGEWKEVVFYVLGDTIETNYLGLRITMGTGSRFDTSGYIKGSVYLAVANCTEIKYSEYSDSNKSGDEVKSFSCANTATASDSVTNGSFSSIDYKTTEEDAFNEDGQLTGIATTSSWTKGTAINNSYNSVTLNVEGENTLKWEPVVGIGVDKDGKVIDTNPEYYEVYARYIDKDKKTVEKLYEVVEHVDGQTEYEVTVENANNLVSTAFRVRAVGQYAVGGYSAYRTLGGSLEASDYVTEYTGNYEKKEVKAGTVIIANEKIGEKGLFEDSSYKSPYKTALKITSTYGVGYKMSAGSKTLNANTYYVISVWVLTVGDATASVTVSNVSNVLTADVDKNYIGYVGINNANWTQYSFIVKTGASSSSFKLELSLGNPYASKVTKKSEKVTSSTAIYTEEELSAGTVYFDAVRVLELSEKEYNAKLEKGEYDEEGNVLLHSFADEFPAIYENNSYAIRNLVYTVDSFDSFTENTTAEDKDGYNNGNTPNNYTQAKASDATGTTEESRLYGVYNYKTDSDKLTHLYMVENTETKEEENAFASFLPAGFDINDFVKMSGSNSLVMSNKIPYGQSYTTSSSSTINSKSYYKLSFNAKAIVAREVKDEDGNKSYTTEGANAEFRFMQNSATDKYQSILINGYEEKTYTMYIYNPSATSSSAKWAFYLGANVDEEDTTGTKQLLIGMMVIDQVELTTITEEDYVAMKASYDALTDEEKVNASTVCYSYDEDKNNTTPASDGNEDNNPVEEKQSIWDRGDVWLLISSLVIAVMIIIVVVVIAVRSWKKKHPKEVVGENVAKTEKEIKVVEPVGVSKEDLIEDEEYSDKMPVVYKQRVTNKKKKK